MTCRHVTEKKVYISSGVSILWGVKFHQSPSNWAVAVSFCNMKADVEYAVWCWELLLGCLYVPLKRVFFWNIGAVAGCFSGHHHWLVWSTFNRKDQVLVNRLMIGHTRLTHSHLLSKEPPPMCTYCSTLLTVEHILTDCFHYQSIRQKFYQNSDLSNIFQVIPPKSLISFIKEI